MGSATIQPLLKLDLLSVDGDPITDERNNFVSAPVTPSEMPDSPEVMDAMENGFGELLFPQEGYGGKEKGSFDYRSSACFQDARLSNTQGWNCFKSILKLSWKLSRSVGSNEAKLSYPVEFLTPQIQSQRSVSTQNRC